MRRKNKIMLGTLGACVTIATPIIATVSCANYDGSSPAKYLKNFTGKFDMKMAKQDGWGVSKKIYVETQESDGHKLKILSPAFVDYLYDKITKIDFTKSRQVFYLNLEGIEVEKLGDHFIDKMKQIKMEEKEYKWIDAGKTFPVIGTIKGSSGILFNVKGVILDSGPAYKLIKDVPVIRKVIFGSKNDYYNETINWSSKEKAWLGWGTVASNGRNALNNMSESIWNKNK